MENRSFPFQDDTSLSGDLSGLDQLDSKFFEENFLDPITSFVPVNIGLYQNKIKIFSKNESFEIQLV